MEPDSADKQNIDEISLPAVIAITRCDEPPGDAADKCICQHLPLFLSQSLNSNAQVGFSSEVVTTYAVKESISPENPLDPTSIRKHHFTARSLLGLCHGLGELTDDSSDCHCDMETRGDNEGESTSLSQPRELRMKPLSNASSCQASENRLSQRTVQDSVSSSSQGTV